MMCLIRLRKDYPEDWIDFEGEEYYKVGWYSKRANPLDLPKSIFDVKVRMCDAGDSCPDCGKGTLEFAFEDDEFGFDFIWCDMCGAMDEDDWWEDAKLKISWRGSGEVRRG